MHHLSDIITQAQLQGSLLVSRGGTTVIEEGYGWADYRTSRKNTPETTFQIASVSKQFTAAAILLLQEQGALSVYDPLHRWLPECPAAWQTITVHHLLTHTSGIGHWKDFSRLNLYQPMARAELLRIFQERGLKFAPGTAWAYSSPGYVLLAHIVELLTGEPYAQFLQHQVLNSLSMVHSGVGSHASCEQQAVGYAGQKTLPSFDLDTVSMGTGDVWATAGDLGCWNKALLKPGRLLSVPSLAAMFAAHASVPDIVSEMHGVSYGYGWFLMDFNGHHVYFHPGDNSGFVSLNLLVPAESLMIVLLCNNEHIELWPLGLKLLEQTLTVI